MTEDQNPREQEAEHLGLRRLAAAYPEQYDKARAAAERLRGGIPRDLHMGEEPAHTFRATEEA